MGPMTTPQEGVRYSRKHQPGSQDLNVSLAEHNLGGLRWIVLHGPDREAFRALGEHARDEIAALTEAWPLLARLRQHVCDPPGSDRLNTVGQASASSFPEVWAELAAFAAGAAVPFEDLAAGCSDRREPSMRPLITCGPTPRPAGLPTRSATGPGGSSAWRPRPGATPSWRSGQHRVRCCGTPTTGGTFLAVRHHRAAIAWRAVTDWAPSPSPARIRTQPGS